MQEKHPQMRHKIARDAIVGIIKQYFHRYYFGALPAILLIAQNAALNDLFKGDRQNRFRFSIADNSFSTAKSLGVELFVRKNSKWKSKQAAEKSSKLKTRC